MRTQLGLDIQLPVVKTALRAAVISQWSGVSVTEGDAISTSVRLLGTDGRRDSSFLRVRQITRFEAL